MKPKIGVDLDCTLSKMMIEWLSRYNRDFGDNLSEEEILDWNITKFIKPEAKKSAIWEYLSSPEFFLNIEPEKGIKEGMKFLCSFADVYIVTAYVPESCLDKTKWVKNNLPDFNQKNIVFCNNKSLMDLDFLIDDGNHNSEGFKGTFIIFDKPWNRRCKKIRLRNWKEIKNFFESVKERWIR